MAQLGMQLASTDGHRSWRCSLFGLRRLTVMPLALLEVLRNRSGIRGSISEASRTGCSGQIGLVDRFRTSRFDVMDEEESLASARQLKVFQRA